MGALDFMRRHFPGLELHSSTPVSYTHLDRYTLEIPAGKLDEPGEPKVECAFRELEEETGFKVESPEKLEYLMSCLLYTSRCV